MRRMTVLTGSVSFFLLLAMVGTVFVTPVAASQTVHNIDLGKDYATIQEAMDDPETLDGHTILVDAGIYNEKLFVNKSLTLVGEDRRTTIVDGNGTGIVVNSNAPDVEIRGFTVQNSGEFPYSGILIGHRAIRNTIRDCIIRNNANGITLFGSNRCSIINNLLMICSWTGIEIKNSSNNIIRENTIANNSIGVWITSSFSLNNTLYHNNFIDNPNQSISFAPTTNWDNGTAGNYWSDYVGVDMDRDGIGDTETPHPGTWGDLNPLIIPTKPFPVVVDDVIYLVAVLSNSTVSSFYFSESKKLISFNVTGPDHTVGFFRVTIPNELLWCDDPEQWQVWVNNTLIEDRKVMEDPNYTYIYFTYNQSIQNVEVIGVHVIPEFPAAIFLSPFIIVTLIVTVLKKRRERKFKSQFFED